MNKFIFLIGISLSHVSNLYAQIRNFEPRELSICISKNETNFQSYEIPELERFFTQETDDNLVLKLNGQYFDNDSLLKLSAENFTTTESPYKALSRLIYMLQQNNFDAWMSMYDEQSVRFIMANYDDATRQSALQSATEIIGLEILLCLRFKNNLLVFANRLTETNKVLIPYQLSLVNNEWKLFSGKIEHSFYQNLHFALGEVGTDIISSQFISVESDQNSTPLGNVVKLQAIPTGLELKAKEPKWYVNGDEIKETGESIKIKMLVVGTNTISARATETSDCTEFSATVKVVGIASIKAFDNRGNQLEENAIVKIGDRTTIKVSSTNNDPWPIDQPTWTGRTGPEKGEAEFVFTAEKEGTYTFKAKCGKSVVEIRLQVVAI